MSDEKKCAGKSQIADLFPPLVLDQLDARPGRFEL